MWDTFDTFDSVHGVFHEVCPHCGRYDGGLEYAENLRKPVTCRACIGKCPEKTRIYQEKWAKQELRVNKAVMEMIEKLPNRRRG